MHHIGGNHVLKSMNKYRNECINGTLSTRQHHQRQCLMLYSLEVVDCESFYHYDLIEQWNPILGDVAPSGHSIFNTTSQT